MATSYLVDNHNIKADPLLDLDFIDKLHHARVRRIHARVIALNRDEQNLENIEGVVTQGSVNVDGSSSVRRTLSLSMVCKEFNIHEFYWGLKTKVEVWTGIENEIDKRYPDIIWFKQGVFVLTSFNTQQGLGNYTVSLQGKDKMVLLNGELGGTITSLSWDFGTESVTNSSGVTTKEKLLLKNIISAAVHTFAIMPFWKIQINDLDDLGLELMEYRGKNPLYMVINSTTGKYNATLNGDTTFYQGKGKKNAIKIKDLQDNQYNPLFELEAAGYTQPTLLTVYDGDDIPYTIARLTYGMTAGYRLTDLTYAGDLILNVGDTITSLLDKIVAMLGEYEYYFDLDGNFIFQRKQVYLQTTWSDIRTNDLHEKWVEPNAYSSDITFSFEDAELITNYSNAPKFDSVRNDFSIWGTRKGVSGKEIPVHLRYAIDEKPTDYVTCDGIKYTTRTKEENTKFEEAISCMTVSEDERDKIAAVNLVNNVSTEYSELIDLMEHRVNPRGLPTKWWDINDWARVWVIVNDGDEAAIPTETMSHYYHSKTRIRASDYFNDPEGLAQKEHSWHLMEVDANFNIINTYHNAGCGHTYTWWLEEMAQTGGHCYIYDPIFPNDMQALVDLKVKEAKQELATIVNLYNKLYTEIHTELDWREIIYQMAEDYNKHHLDEDFYWQVGHNNPYSYPNGVTGYEPYYVDMDGFWRELYNPFYEGHYNVTGMTKLKYQKAVKEWYNKLTGTNYVEFPYFYRSHYYVLSEKTDSFHRDRQYYIKKAESGSNTVYYEAVRPTVQQFYAQFEEGGTIIYYYEPAAESLAKSLTLNKGIENCLIEETFEDANYWFRAYGNSVHQCGYGEIPNQTSKWFRAYPLTDFNAAKLGVELDAYREDTDKVIPLKWFKLHKAYSIPCYKSVPVQSYYVYYYLDENGKETRISGTNIDKDDYYAHPMKYWRYTGEYRQCTENETYIDGLDYYIKGQASRTEEEVYTISKQVTKERFDMNPTRYWVLVHDHIKVNCYTANIPDNIANAFYLSCDKEHIAKLTPLSAGKAIHWTEGGLTYSHRTNDSEDIATRTAYFTQCINEALGQGKEIWAVYCEFVPVVHPIDYDQSTGYYVYDNGDYSTNGWASYVHTDPDSLNFWFDFLDQGGELMKYSNRAIGNRPKAVNDNNVKAIYFRETPNVIFTEEPVPEIPPKQGYTYFQIQPNLLGLFSLSGQGKTAKTVLDQYLYQYAQMAEEITFSTMPYYNLQPNKRIFVSCPESGISGEYIMTRFSVPLGPQTSMSITGVKAVDALY